MRTSLAYSCLLVFPALFQFTAICFSPLQPVPCHKDERLALMQFKESFITDKRVSAATSSAYPKFDNWNFQGVDCCSWDGIECDPITGHVIGLDLSSSCLYGSINSSSTLFHLVHLQTLNLAYNHFNYSVIPSALGNLSMLTYLNLSYSVFSGQIPLEISQLHKLSSLDMESSEGLLELKIPDLKSLIRNLTNLKYLHLSGVAVASPIPIVLANFSSLTSLRLGRCGLLGKFPLAIFHLPNLQILRLMNNLGLTGYFPEFNSTSQLKVLALFNTSFSGELPASIGDLDSLKLLGISHCNFRGLVPSTLGNIPKLEVLDLGYNFFRGFVPSSLGNLTKLYYMDLQSNNFTGSIPSSLGKLPKLEVLHLANGNFTGSIPSELMSLTQLIYLNLMANFLQGSVPSAISRLKKLELFNCYSNRLSGILELDTFLELKHLKYLFLSFNDFYLISRNNTSATSQLVDVGLEYCHLGGFPYFLRSQHQLQFLNLSSNNLHGQIPKWMSEVSLETLLVLDLSNNFLTGFDEFPVVLPWSNLECLKLESNLLQGSLPLPPFFTIFYSIFNNSLTGEIPQLLCNQSSLYILDISHNNLSGEIPQCLSNFSKSLSVLKLRANNFHGPIPRSWASRNRLKMIDLGENKLQGKIPRSLMECRMLEYLDLGKNLVSDAFPSWLGTLPELNVLILCSNALYGMIGDPELNFIFPKLRIIDLSHNRFNGTLPSGYFERWNAMSSLDVRNSSDSYMHEYLNMTINGFNVPRYYAYSMIITNKGMQMEYREIIRSLVAIDMSSNRFDGEIPESIGNLKELHLLNFSNNNLDGRISLGIAKLTNLEALDLSRNKLVGRIPWELCTQLTFLGFLNVSHNHLTGPIPQGHQFDTFQSSSFDENLGLCGKPLLKECDSSGAMPPAPSSTSEDSGLLDWKIVLLGYVIGFLIGVVIGHFVTIRKRDWFAKTFSKSHGRRQKR